jgi:5-methylcytosine-specific restriction endonuclease McrA
MDAALREMVWEQAQGRCEYCRLHQDDADFITFHVEHIIAEQHGGGEELENLCLACPECNFAKGPNLSGFLGGKSFRFSIPVGNRGSAISIGTAQFWWDGRKAAKPRSEF